MFLLLWCFCFTEFALWYGLFVRWKLHTSSKLIMICFRVWGITHFEFCSQYCSKYNISVSKLVLPLFLCSLKSHFFINVRRAPCVMQIGNERNVELLDYHVLYTLHLQKAHRNQRDRLKNFI